MIEKTRGFIIRRKVYRDTSLLLTIYTSDFGKIEGLVKGVRKIEDYGRYDGVVDLFSNYEVILYPRRTGLSLFVQFYLLDSYWDIIRDYSKFNIICSGIELLNYIMQPFDTNIKVYNLLASFLKAMSQSRREVMFYAFIIKLLKFSGFNPRINECLKCGDKIYSRGYFSNSEGGLLCPKCAFKESDLLDLSPGTVKTLNFIEQESYLKSSKLFLSPEVKRELETLLYNFICYHISFIPRGWHVVDTKLEFNNV